MFRSHTVKVAALDGSAAVVQSFIALNPDDTACQAAGDQFERNGITKSEVYRNS